ncbi:nucleoside recognition domain-containing protein [Treponema primitia]|uniref:nucleoside recognition domain-containing protein n=1 Tax=Treponema primitia TaxID=88058 RepID=UPI0002555214|nr:nucleoside recognition domain-containing protein [Treponema primitia]
MEKKSFIHHAGEAGRKALKPAFTTARFLLCIMIPVSFAVLILDCSGVLYYIGRFLGPMMHYLGLPGEAALALISSIFVNIYSALAVIGTLDLTGRELTILATMCFLAHNFFVECAVMKKTGSSMVKMVFLRLFSAILAGWVLHFILPAELGRPVHGAAATEAGLVGTHGIGLNLARLPAVLKVWLIETLINILRIFLIILGIMFIQKLLDEFGVMRLLGRVMAPLMNVFGLPEHTGYLWMVVTLVGLAYGSAILIEEVEIGAVSKTDADLFNHYAGLSHSHLEDTLLFMSIGVPFFWAAIPRFVLGTLAVWLERLRRYLVMRSYRVRVE